MEAGGPPMSPPPLFLGLNRYLWKLAVLGYGIGYFADGMEMYLLSLIQEDIEEEWNMSATDLGMVEGIVFIGMAVGAFGWGVAADRLGRLPIIRFNIVMATILSFCSAASRSALVMGLLRFGFGLSIGGFVPVGGTLLAECTAEGEEGITMALAGQFFTLGGILESLIAIPVLPSLGWRALVLFSAAPLLIPTTTFLIPNFFVESPDWLTACGREAEARISRAVISGLDSTQDHLPPAADYGTASSMCGTEEKVSSLDERLSRLNFPDMKDDGEGGSRGGRQSVSRLSFVGGHVQEGRPEGRLSRVSFVEPASGRPRAASRLSMTDGSGSTDGRASLLLAGVGEEGAHGQAAAGGRAQSFSFGTTKAVEITRRLSIPDPDAGKDAKRPSRVMSVAETLHLVFCTHGCLTVNLSPMWGVGAFLYYGMMFVIPTYFSADYREEAGLEPVDENLVLWLILVTSLFELPGSILGGWGADRYGRRATTITMYTISVIAAVLCSFAVYAELHWAAFLVCVCIIKASMLGSMISLFLYTIEAYPPIICTTALGVCSLFMRGAGFISPNVVQVLLDKSSITATILAYTSTCGIALILALFLPNDKRTKDALEDAIEKMAVEKVARRMSEATPLVSKQPPSLDTMLE